MITEHDTAMMLPPLERFLAPYKERFPDRSQDQSEVLRFLGGRALDAGTDSAVCAVAQAQLLYPRVGRLRCEEQARAVLRNLEHMKDESDSAIKARAFYLAHCAIRDFAKGIHDGLIKYDTELLMGEKLLQIEEVIAALDQDGLRHHNATAFGHDMQESLRILLGIDQYDKDPNIRATQREGVGIAHARLRVAMQSDKNDRPVTRKFLPKSEQFPAIEMVAVAIAQDTKLAPAEAVERVGNVVERAIMTAFGGETPTEIPTAR